jgi:hypothetical protein
MLPIMLDLTMVGGRIVLATSGLRHIQHTPQPKPPLNKRRGDSTSLGNLPKSSIRIRMERGAGSLLVQQIVPARP